MTASSIHLKLAGIDGESSTSQHPAEIEVASWTWGVANTGAAAGAGSGAGSGAGRATFSDLTFTHRVDRASPLLWKACATGKHIQTGALAVARPGGNTQDYLVIKLRDVLVTSVALADVESDGQPPVESVTLSFAKVEYGYKPQKANGSLGVAVELKFDIQANKVL